MPSTNHDDSLIQRITDIGKLRNSDAVAIVVTYNRKKLLIQCLDLLLQQSKKTDILVVDNASDDGTLQDIVKANLIEHKNIHYIYLSRNTGGAGGFYHGMKYAFYKGWEWFWIMDDDAEPLESAFKNINAAIGGKWKIYGSTAINDIDGTSKLCFPTKRIINGKIQIVENYNDIEKRESVEWLPFLGFLINREIVKIIGYPEKEFFIRNDDIEYAERAKKHGIDMILVKDSILYHPFQPTVVITVLGKKIYYRTMPPWKFFYEIRNKIIIAQRHYTLIKGIKSILGATLQLMMSMVLEKDKKNYAKAYFSGLVEGLKAIL